MKNKFKVVVECGFWYNVQLWYDKEKIMESHGYSFQKDAEAEAKKIRKVLKKLFKENK